jgi:zinc protease
MELNKEAVANQKRGTYMTVATVTILPLKGKDFKVELASEVKIGGKAAVGVKATGPDGKDFKIYFDKESGLPVKAVAKVVGPMGGEFEQETTFADFKEMDGIKKATTVKATRDGEKFSEQKITEFKVLEKIEAKTFAEP